MNQPRAWSTPPMKRMFGGLGIIAVASVGAVLFVLLTIFFFTTIGFLFTALMYLILILMTTVYRICRKVKRMGHSFGTVREWNTDNADLEGSTARYGVPHDHGSYIARRKVVQGQMLNDDQQL